MQLRPNLSTLNLRHLRKWRAWCKSHNNSLAVIQEKVWTVLVQGWMNGPATITNWRDGQWGGYNVIAKMLIWAQFCGSFSLCKTLSAWWGHENRNPEQRIWHERALICTLETYLMAPPPCTVRAGTGKSNVACLGVPMKFANWATMFEMPRQQCPTSSVIPSNDWLIGISIVDYNYPHSAA